MTDIITVKNLFSSEEREKIDSLFNNANWLFERTSGTDPLEIVFWGARLDSYDGIRLFKDKIESGIKKKVEITSIVANGQSHSQCGIWHQDPHDKNDTHSCFTMVYFPYEWSPEYGGHLMIQSNEIISILPEFNKAVIFNSYLYHMGLEPTVHCKKQRVSIACVFKVVNE